MIDYELANKLHRKHKAALTRAKKKSPEAVLEAVQKFYDEFEDNDLPLTDDWHDWQRAADDASYEIARRDGTGLFANNLFA